MHLKDIMYEMDKKYNGDHMDHQVATMAVHKFGERFPRQWIKEHVTNPTVCEEDMYYVMNMLYSDYKELLKEDEQAYIKMAELFIHDVDGPSDKAKRYFYAMLE